MRNTQYIYGINAVAEALRGKRTQVSNLVVTDSTAKRVVALCQDASNRGIPWRTVARGHVDHLVGPVVHQGVVAEVAPLAYASLDEVLARTVFPALLVVVDHVQDPHNFGSLIRSASALGAHGVVFAKDRNCDVTPVVAKAAAGALAHMPLARVTNLSRAMGMAQEAGLWLVGTSPGADKSLEEVDLRGPVGLVMGGEANGMRRSTRLACDFIATIPMDAAAESLNVAVAGGIALYEVARQRSRR